MSKILTRILIGAALAYPTIADARDTPEAQMEKLLAGRVAGTPVNCITARNSSSRVIPGKAIVYTVGGTIYVNEVQGADVLRDDQVLVTRLYTSQLCSIDLVELRDRTTGVFRGTVNLGKFVPYTKVKSPA